MPTLLEVKFTRADGKRETDTRVEAPDADVPLKLLVPDYSGLAKLPEGAEVTEVIIAHPMRLRQEEKYMRVRMITNRNLGTGFHEVELRDASDPAIVHESN